ncbi:hypothetical protein [Halorubrum sp. 48-1-W]|uniref:hypothetical protein n=1 Tax=Halorubrum sp. 48-1-W TaxID=2249761 RepID=UPI0018E529B9|nr:hypothetical protein [Halorubrum sp. 48-1-W]
MCHHVGEALSPEEIRERHRSWAAEGEPDDAPDGGLDEPAETDEPDPPRVPAGD